MSDSLIDDLERASAIVGDLLDRVTEEQWTAPTPCTDWHVRGIVDHLVGMNLVFVAMFEESPMPERGVDRLGDDPAAAFRRSAAALQAAVVRPGVLDRSQATGRAAELPEELAEQALAFVQVQLPTSREPDGSRIRNRSATMRPPSTGLPP